MSITLDDALKIFYPTVIGAREMLEDGHLLRGAVHSNQHTRDRSFTPHSIKPTIGTRNHSHLYKSEIHQSYLNKGEDASDKHQVSQSLYDTHRDQEGLESYSVGIDASGSLTCGCNGDRSLPGCEYTDTGRTSIEAACSASNGTGGIIDITELRDTWASNNCREIYSNILYTLPDSTLGYNPANLSRIQSDIDHLMSTYVGPYGYEFTTDTSSSKYNPFQENLLAMCSDPLLPGGCNLFLSNYCPKYTRDEISRNRALASVCGCYAPPAYPTSTVPSQCDSLCHLVGVSQQSQPCTGIIPTCSNTVCVIDNVNINLVNNNTSSNTAFQQICPACNPSNPCTCIIGGIDVKDTLERSGVGVNYTQYCGTNAQCFEKDAVGNLTQVQCPTTIDFEGEPSTFNVIPWLVIGIIAIVIFFIIVIVIAVRSSGYQRRS